MTRPYATATVPERLAELSARLGRCPDLDVLVETSLRGLDELFGFRHSILLLLDDDHTRLHTLASHGYDVEGVGSEIRLGEGIIGMSAARSAPMRVGTLQKMLGYARRVRRAFEEEGVEAPGSEIALPGLPAAESQLAVPAMVLGELVGVLGVESEDQLAFTDEDEALLAVVATLIASAIEIDGAHERAECERGDDPVPARGRARDRAVPSAAPVVSQTSEPTTHIRFFESDGSTFVDGDYLIKGVPGRILRALLTRREAEGREEFTNREVRLDRSLELPEYRDNLESRLILLKRRLDERSVPVRIEKTGRGRFRLLVSTRVTLECVTREGP